MEKLEEFLGEYIVAYSFRSVEDNFLWAFFCVYGPNMDSNRSFLWDELVGLYKWWNLPLCIGEILM